MQSIRTKISLITMIAIVVSVFLIGGIGVLFIRDEGERESDTVMTLLCDNKRRTLNEYMKSIEQSADMVSRYAEEELDAAELAAGGVIGAQGDGAAMEGRDWQSEQQAKLDAYLKQYGEKVEAVFLSAANHTYGVSAYYFCLNPELTGEAPGFLFTKSDADTFTRQTISDVFSLTHGDFSHMDWYSLPLQTGRPSWLSPYYNANLNEKMISYVVPIFKEATFIGVVGMDIGYETLVSQIDSILIYETGYACLLDAEGIIVYHPHMASGAHVESIVPAMAEAANQPAMDENDVYIFRYNYEEIEKKAVFASLENGLRLVIMAPVEEINGTWYDLIKGFLFIGLGIMLVFGIVTTMATQRIIEPLHKLTAASQRIAEGDYEVKLEYDGNDEVGILTKSFQHLIDHLKAYINDLNSKAYKDVLTHVKNKEAFEIQLRKMDELLIPQEEGGKTPNFAIAMFDCDSLENFNDRYGHANGDQYLLTGCTFICKLFAHSPVFRVGGDEFAVILQGEDYKNIDSLFDSFDEKIEAANAAAEYPWDEVHITKGIAVYDKEIDLDAASVFKRADEELNKDKESLKAVSTDAG